jgi:site-specific DNA-cytosine methylase
MSGPTAPGRLPASAAADPYLVDHPGPGSVGGGELVLGSLCTGYGGLDLGVLAALGGGRLAWVADPDPAVRAVLAARFGGVPNLGDITAVDWATVDPVHVLTAGFPCQDISFAGRGAGITEGTRSGLWYSVLHAVCCLRPALLVVENVAALRSRKGGLGTVLGGLAGIGYDANWRSLRAADIGAAHRRERVFLLAYPAGTRLVDAADPAGPRLAHPRRSDPAAQQPDRREPARPAAPATAHPAGHRRARRPAPEPAFGPPPAGQPPRRSHRTAKPTAPVRLLPTPAAGNPNDGEDPAGWLRRQARQHSRRINGNGMGMPLSVAVRLLPTPRATDTGTPGHQSTPDRRPMLGQQVLRLFPTPLAVEGLKGSPNQRSSAGQPGLTATVLRLLPTPRAASNRNSRAALSRQRSGPGLEQAVEIILGIRPVELTGPGRPPPSWHTPTRPETATG